MHHRLDILTIFQCGARVAVFRVPKLTDISRISLVVHVLDHFVDGKLVAGLNAE